MRKFHLIVAATVLAAASAAAAVYLWRTETSSSVEGEMQRVVRAVFADDRLWLLTLSGSLASLIPEAAEPKSEQVPGKVADICKLDGHLAVVTLDDAKAEWTIRLRSADHWASQLSVPTERDTLVALSCQTGSIILITNRRLVEVWGGKVRVTPLSEKIQPALVTATAFAREDMVWMGFNAGEWGGGLTRISRANGKVEPVEHNTSGALCGGPLNTSCDPVNGIVAAPWKPSCVIAIGLRLVEIWDSLGG